MTSSPFRVVDEINQGINKLSIFPNHDNFIYIYVIIYYMYNILYV